MGSARENEGEDAAVAQSTSASERGVMAQRRLRIREALEKTRTARGSVAPSGASKCVGGGAEKPPSQAPRVLELYRLVGRTLPERSHRLELGGLLQREVSGEAQGGPGRKDVSSSGKVEEGW